MELTQFVTLTFLAAFAGVLPPGLVNMTVAKTALEKDKKNGLYATIGVCIVNFIHAFIAILMAKYIFSHPSIHSVILEFALIVFTALAVYFIFAAWRNKPIKPRESKKESKRSFAKGFLVANLNILPIPYFVFISIELSPGSNSTYDWLHIILFSLAATLGTFTVLYLYIVSFVKLEKRMKSLTKYANYFMAVLMIALVIITLIRILNGG